MSVPNTFASATSAIPLANLDANFAYYDSAFQISGTAMEVNYTFRLEDPTDNTKKAEFVMSGITTGTTRQYTMPNASGTLATLANTSQTFLGSTVFAPSTNSGTITIGGIPQTGTVTLGRSTASQTVDIAVGATTAVSTKTVNIGTAGVSGSTTNINFGSAVSGALVTYIWNAGANSMRLNSSGNLGLGVGANAGWASGYKVIQNLGTSWFATTSRDANFGTNVYVDAGGYKYIDASAASLYTQWLGAHSWYRSTSAQTAGTDPVFSQAMTLDASGNLLVGTTSAAGVATNTARVVGGVFSTVSGSVAATTSVATTVLTLPGYDATYLVSALIVSGDAVNYSATNLVFTQASGGGNSVVNTVLKSGNLLSISMSGYNIQVTQLSGASATVTCSVTRIA